MDLGLAINTWKQALHELETARSDAEHGQYYACVFWCQQCVEKGLKALHMLARRELPPRTHSLVTLGKAVSVPPLYNAFLRRLTSEYFMTRYAELAGEVPAESYTREDCRDCLEQTEEICQWLGSQIKPLTEQLGG